jgi:hypothetical protein
MTQDPRDDGSSRRTSPDHRTIPEALWEASRGHPPKWSTKPDRWTTEVTLQPRTRSLPQPAPRCRASHVLLRVAEKPPQSTETHPKVRARPLQSSLHVSQSRLPRHPRKREQPQRLGATEVALHPSVEGRPLPTPRRREVTFGANHEETLHRSQRQQHTRRVGHVFSTHRDVPRPRDHFPGRPPRWLTDAGSRQPRSPLTPARGSRSLRHRGAGRATFGFDA